MKGVDMQKIQNIAVIGAGIMGHGIAQVFANKGFSVNLYDLNQDLLDRALAGIAENLRTLVEMGMETRETAELTLSRVIPVTNFEKAVADADLVVEAVTEDLEIKRDLYARIDRYAPKKAILASNTSMLSISNFGSKVKDPSRLIITHWFNPPHIVPVVEVVLGDHTSDETLQNIFELLTRIGKTPVLVRKEIPGFLVNRIQAAMFREVLSLLEMGVASAEDIDKAVVGSFGLRLSVQGVLKTMDLAGLDLMLKGCSHLFKDINSSKQEPKILSNVVLQGDLGVKTGRGFFSYEGASPCSGGISPTEERDRALLSVLKALAQTDSKAGETD
jgi:3-hydroxybutyryl-CoA dehydrogenase